MVKTRTQQECGSEESTQPEIKRLVASEVDEALQKLLPGLVNQIKTELELETQAQKRKQMHTPNVPSKKFKPSEDKEEKRENFPSCNKCGRKHIGGCQSELRSCYKCGKMGHISKDCKETQMWCFNCHQLGHIKANCPKLTEGTVQPPAPATLRLTGSSSGAKAETPKPRGRAFQLMTEEARVTPDNE